MKRWVLLPGLAFMVAAAPMLLFRDTATESRVDFKLVSGTPEKHFIIESMAGGVALFDYNNDGLLDIYFANGSTMEAERAGNNTAEDRLFRNKGDGTFADVTHAAGLGDRRWTMGVAIADVNNDGFEDIYITNFGGNRLYLNRGDGTFRDFTEESGTGMTGWSSGAAFADYDGDGNLDLYVSQYLEFNLATLPKDSLLCRYHNIPVQCGPRGLTPSHGHLFHNAGGGHFVDITTKSGIGKVPPAYGLGVVWGDYDDDGRPDLFVGNDSLPAYLFHNDGNGTFSEVALTAGVALREDGREQADMGVDFADYDNDGKLDLLVTTFSDDYKTLFHNEGKGHFTDVSRSAGLVQATWNLLSWGVQFVDLNNDGYLDIAMANGHVYPEVDQHHLPSPYRQRPSYFVNLKDGRFKDAGPEAGPAFQQAGASRGLAVGDLNNDGFMDVVISNLDAQPWIIKNPGGSGRWIVLELRGTTSNRDAVGARITARTGSRTQIREVKSGGSYQSHSDFRVHFGLGTAAFVDELTIRWPSGLIQTLKHVKSDQFLKIEEAKATGKTTD